jgi:hypothetical protein
MGVKGDEKDREREREREREERMKKQCSNFPTSIEIGNITSIV